MLYWLDPQMFPNLEDWIGALSLAAVLANTAAALVGFYLTRRGVFTEDRRLINAPWAIAGFIVLAVVLFFGNRVALVGDYDSFWKGEADLFFMHAAGWAGLLLYASAGALVWWVRRHHANSDPSIV